MDETRESLDGLDREGWKDGARRGRTGSQRRNPHLSNAGRGLAAPRRRFSAISKTPDRIHPQSQSGSEGPHPLDQSESRTRSRGGGVREFVDVAVDEQPFPPRFLEVPRKNRLFRSRQRLGATAGETDGSGNTGCLPGRRIVGPASGGPGQPPGGGV